jgi:hypothetical protein
MGIFSPAPDLNDRRLRRIPRISRTGNVVDAGQTAH